MDEWCCGAGARKQKEKRRKALEKKRAQNEAKKAAEAAAVQPRVSALAKRRWFFKEMKHVIDAADVILEVLPAVAAALLRCCADGLVDCAGAGRARPAGVPVQGDRAAGAVEDAGARHRPQDPRARPQQDR